MSKGRSRKTDYVFVEMMLKFIYELPNVVPCTHRCTRTLGAKNAISKRRYGLSCLNVHTS